MDFNNILGKFNDLGIKNEGLTPDDPAQRQQAQQQKVEVSTQNAGKTDEQLTPNDMAALAGLYIKESKQPTAQKEVIKESINESTDLIQKLSEKWATLKDDALGTAERRPAREGSRHPRGHEPQEQYTIIQDDEENKSVNEGYKGWTYSSHEEDYDDVMKLSHVATKDGKEVSMDWSPYNKPSAEEFKLWVDLGMPTRKDVDSIGPLDKDDLLKLAKTKQGTHKLLQKESREAEKRVQTKLKNIERLKTPISDKAWKDHQERMKKEREEYIKKNPDSIFKEEDVLSIKEDPFGQWVLVDKQDGHIKQAFDDKEHAYKYWDHFKLDSKEYKIMHGSEYVDSEYEEGLAEYGATSTGSPTSTNQAGSGDQAQKVAAATQAIKSATGSTASQQQIAKAIDTASQGKTDPLTAKTIDPMMDIMKKAAEDPALAQQFKSLAARAKQIK